MQLEVIQKLLLHSIGVERVQNFKVARGLTSGHTVMLKREDQGVTIQQVSPGVGLWAQVKHLSDYSTSSSSLVHPWRICL